MFSGFAITRKGQALRAKVEAGAVMELTRFQVGKGELREGQTAAMMEALNDPVSYYPIARQESADNVASVAFQLTNIGILYAWDWRELGLFAKDPDEGEILYAYANAGDTPDVIPASTTSLVEYYYSLKISISNSAIVNVNIDESMIYATQKYANELVEDMLPVNDGAVSTDSVWSSYKVQSQINNLGLSIVDGQLCVTYEEGV